MSESDKKLETGRPWNDAQPNFNNIKELKGLKNIVYAPAIAFFGTSNIEQWTRELDALNSIDIDFHVENNNEIKNEFAYKAFLLMDDPHEEKGYLMTRMVVANGRLPELEQKLDGKYIRKTINV